MRTKWNIPLVVLGRGLNVGEIQTGHVRNVSAGVKRENNRYFSSCRTKFMKTEWGLYTVNPKLLFACACDFKSQTRSEQHTYLHSWVAAMPRMWQWRMLKHNPCHMPFLEHSLHHRHSRWVSAQPLRRRLQRDGDRMTLLFLQWILLTVLTWFTVALSDSIPVLRVNKNCSSPLTCVTQVNTPTEWSVNRGFVKTAFNQLCCMSDSCNFPTLAGKTCFVHKPKILSDCFVTQHINGLNVLFVLQHKCNQVPQRGRPEVLHFSRAL